MSVKHPPDVAAYLAGLDRRRSAALRLPALDCGRRDPLACLTDDESPAPASYCCSSLGLAESAALALMGRFCSATTCARLPMADVDKRALRLTEMAEGSERDLLYAMIGPGS